MNDLNEGHLVAQVEAVLEKWHGKENSCNITSYLRLKREFGTIQILQRQGCGNYDLPSDGKIACKIATTADIADTILILPNMTALGTQMKH